MKRYLMGLVGCCAMLGLALGQAQTLTTSGYPIEAVPSQAEQEADPVKRAYAGILQRWLDENDVTLEEVAFNTWDQQALLTAIAGGTSPSYFSAGVLGNWNDANTQTAFKQGLAADITELIEARGIGDKIPETARPLWEQWAVDGRYYGLPEAYLLNIGVYYRKDLIQELGLKEPEPGWTWDDFRALAKALTTPERKGAIVQPWVISWSELNANGWPILTSVPAPDTAWNWQVDYTSNAEQWVSIFDRWRTAMYEDQSVLTQETGFSDAEIIGRFIRGETAIAVNNPGFYTRLPTDPEGLSMLAERLGRPIEEVVGWVEMPKGEFDTLSATQPFLGLASLSPDLSDDALEKAVSLFDYMFFGEGYVAQKQAAWEATQDLRYVYTEVLPVSGMTQIPGVPGTLEDAWGEAFVNRVNEAAKNPPVPNTVLYFPAETATGPGGVALQDALNEIIFTAGEVDIAGRLEQAETIMNEQAASFSSSIPDDVFIASANAYYDALDAFYQEHSPEYYEQIYRPWQEAHVTPVIGE